MKYAVDIERAGENFLAYVPDLPGCSATGISLPLKLNSLFAKRSRFIWKVCGSMGWRYLSPLVTLVMSNLLRNLNEVKANIQIQKTGAEAWFWPETSARR